LLKMFNDILCSADSQQAVLLTLLDLSAAFDTVDHGILLSRLELEFGVCDDALAWTQSYLDNRSQSTVINGVRSTVRHLACGLPQGSLVGPFCFPPYSSHIGKIARRHAIDVHTYADDTQLYLSFHPDHERAAVEQMTGCINEIRKWMEANMLKLNDSKTEFLVIGSEHVQSKLTDTVKSIQVGNAIVPATDSAKNIGALLDSRLDMVQHINKTTSACYFHLRNISRIRKSLTSDAAKTLVHALVISKLDNLNSLLYKVPDKLIRKLQLVQNQAARIIALLRRNDHITPTLQKLHWLPIHYRIEYKINLLTFKCLKGSAPQYLCDLIEEYVPARNLRSSDKGYLKGKKARCQMYGERGFSVCAPNLWDGLPPHVRDVETLDAFKKALKTHYFKAAYDV
jgi:hypothetical protein